MTSIKIDSGNMAEGLSGFDDTQLKALISTAQNVIESRKASQQKEALEQIRKLALQAGLQVEIKSEGAKAKSGRQPLPPLYRNPDDAEQTWSGRGARPKWFKAALEAGIDPESLKI